MSASASHSPSPGTVYVVDDERALRDGVAWLLRSRRVHYECLESAEAFEQLLDANEARYGGAGTWPHSPSCLLLDVRMPGMGGMGLFDRLSKRGLAQRIPVIFLTGHGDVAAAVRAVKQGAFHYAVKPPQGDELLECIDQALAASSHALQHAQRGRAVRERLGQLSRREFEVIDAVSTGLQNREVAEHLGISPRTVEVHRSNAYEKLGVRSTSELNSLLAGAPDALAELRPARTTGADEA
jgi:two-component system, LuxR family, response regulator DctR